MRYIPSQTQHVKALGLHKASQHKHTELFYWLIERFGCARSVPVLILVSINTKHNKYKKTTSISSRKKSIQTSSTSTNWVVTQHRTHLCGIYIFKWIDKHFKFVCSLIKASLCRYIHSAMSLKKREENECFIKKKWANEC